MTSEIISQILNKDLTDEEKSKFLYEELLKVLDGSKGLFDEVLNNCQISAQKVGNCSWMNKEGAVLAFSIMHAYKEQQQKNGTVSKKDFQNIIDEQLSMFAQWRSYQQVAAIHKYLKSLEGEKAYPAPDYELISEAMVYSYPKGKEGLAPALLSKWQETETLYNHLIPERFKRAYS